MNKMTLLKISMFMMIFVFSSVLQAKPDEIIELPSPDMTGGKPLMEALKGRKSTRSFSSRELSLQQLSNLLWAGFGINRPEEGKRTAPSAMNWQEIDIYVARKDGLFKYNAEENILIKVLDEDIRAETGMQSFVKDAPVNLIYVADYSTMGSSSKEQKDFYSAADTGFIAQNVYLYCASEGLATVVRGAVDKDKLHEVMNLKKDQKVILAHTVGYPGG